MDIKKKMKSKLALITSGGGMGCAYSAGAILAFVEKYNFKNPDIMIGGSGSTGALSYYIAGQYNSIKKIWTQLIVTNKFINKLRLKKIIDVDYVIDTIFKEQEPLNVKKIYSSKVLYLIATTNFKNGKLEYFSNKDGTNILEDMRASMAIPLVYNKIIKIKRKNFCDTPISSSTGLNIKKAIDLGANKIIVINTECLPSFGRRLFDIWLFLKSKVFKYNYNHEIQLQQHLKLPDNIRIIHLSPKKKMKAGLLDNNKKDLKDTFNQGYNETLKNKELRNFLH